METYELGIRHIAMICFAWHARYMSLDIYHLHINEQNWLADKEQKHLPSFP